jgi:hypothetical protein
MYVEVAFFERWWIQLSQEKQVDMEKRALHHWKKRVGDERWEF